MEKAYYIADCSHLAGYILHYILLGEIDCSPAGHIEDNHHSLDRLDYYSSSDIRPDRSPLRIVESFDLAGRIALQAGTSLHQVGMSLLVGCSGSSVVFVLKDYYHPGRRDHLPMS